MTTLAQLTAHDRALFGLCWHESAHAVVGVVLGGRLTAATVTDGENRGGVLGLPTGLTSFATLPAGRATASIAYAGPWAEARGRLGRRPTSPEVSAVLAASGRHDRDALCAAGGPVVDAEVVPLLDTVWPAVAALAVQLARSGSITHADVCAALGVPADDNGIELSHIRAGAAPGTFTVTRPTSA